MDVGHFVQVDCKKGDLEVMAEEHHMIEKDFVHYFEKLDYRKDCFVV